MKKIIEFIKELKKKPYGKSVLFFGFYLIFFIVIFIILGIRGNVNIKNNYDNNSKIININLLNTKKYSFNYEVNLDNSVNTYIIKKNDRYEYKYNDKNNANLSVSVTFMEDDVYTHYSSKNADGDMKFFKSEISDVFEKYKVCYST